MNLSESYKNRIQHLAGIKNENQESQEFAEFAAQVNNDWANRVKSDKDAKPEDSILFGALCNTYELSKELANEVLELLNQHIGEKISENDEIIEKLHSIISRTTGDHPGPLSEPSSTSKENLKDFIKTNESH